MAAECIVCEHNARIEQLPSSERLYVDDRWRAAHAWSALPGWLVLVPRRHVTAFAELTAAEYGPLGPLLHAASAALHAVVGCEKTYLFLLGEHPRFPHLHLHLVPRMADFSPDQVGTAVFTFLERDENEWVPAEERARLAAEISAEIGAGLHGRDNR